MQYFYINQGSVNPTLRVELLHDGNTDFIKSSVFNEAIQNSDVTFSMVDENGILRISKAPCEVVLSVMDSCEENYIIEYRWKERDTRKKGKYTGRFEIKFRDDISSEGKSYPSGNLIVPIFEDLVIEIK